MNSKLKIAIVMSVCLFAIGFLATQNFEKKTESKVDTGRLESPENKNREVAAIEVDPMVQDINNRLTHAVDHSDLEKVITEVVQTKASPTPEANGLKVYQAVLGPILHLRSFIWRSINVVERFPAVHSMAIYTLRRFYGNLSTKSPHVSVWADFLTHPPVRTGHPARQQFTSLSHVQNEFVNVLAPTLIASIAKLKEVEDSYGTREDNPAVFALDLSLIYGDRANSVLVEDAKSFTVTLADISVLKGYMQKALATGLYMSSYNFEGLDSVLGELGFEYRVNAYARALIDRKKNFLTSSALLRKFEERKYDKLFTLREDIKFQGQDTLSASKPYFLESYKSKEAALKRFAANPDHRDRYRSFDYLFDGRITELSQDRVALMIRLLSSDKPVAVQDQLFGESVTLDFGKMFDPKAMKNLKAFMATSSSTIETPERLSDGIRNYRLGTKTALKDASLGKVFPNVQNIEQLRQAREVVQRSQVGFPMVNWMEMFL
jgi:hypothetical protein